jgi:glycosyltransferase involved in cell wall biosynthesis
MLHEFEPNQMEPAILSALALEPCGYLLYPSNFWPHKNHATLFKALEETQTRPALKLVCTGAPSAARDALQSQADASLGPNAVLFPGHVSEPELHTLMDRCAALIYPSLYEGFGMPVLEGMSRAKPVLCSSIPSLREVAGGAATYFEPTSTAQIVSAINSLTSDPAGINQRVALGSERVRKFGSASDTAQKYIRVIDEVLEKI